MEKIFLDVELRQGTGRAKAKDLRDAGFIPAVVYKEGKDSHAIKVPRRQLLQLMHQHGLENVVINLQVKDDKKIQSRPCLIKEIQYEPVLDEIIHIDFNEISLTKLIKLNVPVVAKGEPIGVKIEGGSLEHILWEVEVECLPTDMPKEIEIDVSAMKMGESIHVKDFILSPGVKVLTEPETTVLSVVEPMKEEAPAEAAEGEAPQEPEVIKEKKEVEGEGEEAGAPDKEKKEPKEKKEKEDKEKK